MRFTDKIYFAWLPVKMEKGYLWLTWIRDVLAIQSHTTDVFLREKYQYTKWWFFRIY